MGHTTGGLVSRFVLEILPYVCTTNRPIVFMLLHTCAMVSDAGLDLYKRGIEVLRLRTCAHCFAKALYPTEDTFEFEWIVYQDILQPKSS